MFVMIFLFSALKEFGYVITKDEIWKRDYFHDGTTFKDPFFFTAIKTDAECAMYCQRDACLSFTVFNNTCSGYRRIFDYLEWSYLEPGARHFKKSVDCHENGYFKLSSVNACYKIYEDLMNWMESERICNSDGGFLAKLDTTDKLNSIKTILQMYGRPLGVYDYLLSSVDTTIIEYWTGLQDKEMTGEWKWVSNQDVLLTSSSLWSSNEPNGGGFESCVGVQRNDGLFDNPCDEKPAFICEK